ncbi:hypothetical protein WOLCODRAFT_17384 [Wolfiporia cocos MD-104 SS10]|uniref:Endopeptidase S2P n=1 Tax=Wolfiporia cocos (strain MD-104) TaxID=742152 RepID=A0A2H3JSU5_WOLCO|nr:hypothetical protein WOLCODRAFT_17384 [Wolfiporia cocos MD-104 SS10]
MGPLADEIKSLIVWTCVLWVCLHLVHRFSPRRSSRTVLPLALTSATRTEVSLQGVHLRVSTTALNNYFSRRNVDRTKHRRIYDAGSVAGVLGLGTALGLLVFTTFQMTMSHSSAHNTSAQLGKRDLSPEIPPSGSDYARNYDTPLQLIIPGVTVPLAHLPILLFTLLSSQVFHEAGHAFAAAIESIPVLSTGASLTLLIPSAFVSLPTAAVSALPARARLRIASAGAFHNLALWLALIVLARVPLHALLGYADVGAWGAVVIAVEERSPLQAHLPVGSVITHVDDEPLTEPSWPTLLLQSPASDMQDNLGWCAQRPWFEEQPAACCATTASPELACFVAAEPARMERCADPLPFLGGADARRCASAADCGAHHVCVHPRADEALVRLAVRPPPWTHDPAERVVVWRGPRSEILEEVEVSKWAPRWRYSPVTLPSILDAIMG